MYLANYINLICKQCNNEFTIKKGGEKLFCSKECKSKNRKGLDNKY